MILDSREKFNSSFTERKYLELLHELDEYAGEKIPFRIAETPVFVPAGLGKKLQIACRSIIDFIKQPAYKELTQHAIPPVFNVPDEDDHSMWLAFDFAICRNAGGQLEPRMIEMQGFPSLFYYQHLLAQKYRKHFDIGRNLDHLFGRSADDYEAYMKSLLLNNHDPENVILLEVEPEKQNTRIDFVATHQFTGIRTVCISKLKRSGKNLYYEFEGKLIPVYRIYNRVIFDEFKKRTDLTCEFNFTENVNVEWAGHPNWFFRISKFTIPFLKNDFVPETSFLHELKKIPGDLENFVLKPLYSFSGSGVIFHVTPKDVESVKDPENWILQRKVQYEPVIRAPDGYVKTEIRMLYGWQPGSENPELIINMARLSRGEMIGVKYNKNMNWVGGSVGMFEV